MKDPSLLFLVSQTNFTPSPDCGSHAMDIGLHLGHQLAYVKPPSFLSTPRGQISFSRRDNHVSRGFSWLTSAGHLREAAGKGDRPRRCSLDGVCSLGVSIEWYKLVASNPTFFIKTMDAMSDASPFLGGGLQDTLQWQAEWQPV
ncbi:hypothetical protein CORC01_12674 [Colletotrichum orchidophilum]|uniref:Uncharacterized protein n=1 Tax=Colletotrichum orchidophilum TaxID=1209926 RepID=A0A1G4ASE5_9PEZI|nr:uncharacterized protein CORC01_12674 [Colletotrichum orchidophilum]OHE92035.1 hypothetical protein CORC01_12674 [Colletotrichum orchidophilum]